MAADFLFDATDRAQGDAEVAKELLALGAEKAGRGFGVKPALA
jgi:hypothetical protein